MVSSKKFIDPFTFYGALHGRVFIGALPKNTTKDTFLNHFQKYGNIKAYFIIIDKGDKGDQLRGFGVIKYGDSCAVDKVIQETQIMNGQKVEVTRTLAESNDFKTNKYFRGVFIKEMEDISKQVKKRMKKKDRAVSMDVCQAMDTSSASGVLNRTIQRKPMKRSKKVRKMKSIVEAISKMTL